MPFVEEVASLAKPHSETTVVSTEATPLTTQAMLLLLPFVLGFSTTLVIMVLNQLVEGVQAIFGRRNAIPSGLGYGRTVAPRPYLPSPTPSGGVGLSFGQPAPVTATTRVPALSPVSVSHPTALTTESPRENGAD